MKVLCLAKDLNSRQGWGRYAVELIKGLHALGVETITCTQDGPNRGEHALLTPPRWKFRDVWDARRDARRIAGQGLEFDLIHALDETAALAGHELARLQARPLAITLHGTYSVVPLAGWSGLPFRRAFGAADLVLANSDYTLDRSARALRRTYRYAEVTPLGVDASLIDADPRPLEQRTRTILSIGAVKARKGMLENIRAFASVHPQVPDAKLVIAGSYSDDLYYRQVRQEIRDLGLEDHVQLLGEVSEAQIDELYRSARVLCMPALCERDNFEGFGLVHLEAAAKGLPTIGSLEGGNSGAIQDGETGLLINPRSIGEIQDAMAKLLTDDALWTSMSRNASGWAATMNWDTTARATKQAYADILSRA